MRILLHLFVFLFLSAFPFQQVQAVEPNEGNLYFSEKGYVYIKVKVKGIEGLHYFLVDINGRNFFREDKLHLLRPDMRAKNKAFVSFEEVEFGGNIWRNQTFRLMNAKRRMGADMMPDSVIGGVGYKFLRNYCWQFNYQEKKIRFALKSDNLPFSRRVMEFHAYTTPIDKSIALYLSLNNEAAERFVVSTSWPLGICLSPEILGNVNSGLQQNGQLIYPQLRSMKEVQVHNFISGSLTINEKACFNRMNISVSENFESIIGNDFLKNFILGIDWNNRKVFLDPLNHLGNFTPKD